MLAEMVDRLVSLGHRVGDIEHYTIRQMDAYVELGNRREAVNDRGMVSMMRSAYHADAQQFKKIVASFKTE
jgi:hypothetical protein